jgi:serine/threonine protein kinase/tetratricopeptide (TPR) repeat protein
MNDRQVGPYRIATIIGEGGMGSVYLAHHVETGERVALKVLAPERTDFADLKRFQREQQLVCGLNHPHLVKILEGGTADDVRYVAMEFLEGDTLEHLLHRDSPLTLERAIAIGRDIASGLAALHERGIVHRDLKPSNVMVSPAWTAKVIDYGLARQVDTTLLTMPGQVMGTLAYLAPELVEQEAPTSAVDMWALGCVLYRMIVGRLPIDGKTPILLLTGIVSEPIAHPVTVNPGVPAELGALVMQLLTREVKLRLTDARVVVDKLEALQKVPRVVRTPLAAVRTPRSQIRHESSQKFRGQWPIRALGITGLLLATLGILWPVRQQKPYPPQATPVSARPEKRLATTDRVFEDWRKVKPLLHLMRTRRIDARTHETLCRVTNVDLGHDADTWIYWVRLGEWLDLPKRSAEPPRRTGAHTGHWKPTPVGDANHNYIDAALAETTWRSILKSIDNIPQASQLKCVLVATWEWPDDGRAWLQLGNIVEKEGLDAFARSLFERGLRMINGEILYSWPRSTWRAFCRALRSVRDPQLEELWLAAVKPYATQDPALAGLVDALGDDMPRLSRLLQKAAQLPQYRTTAREWLGQAHLELNRKEEARRVWEQLWHGGLRTLTLADRLVNINLSLGDVEGARSYMKGSRNEIAMESACQYCEGPPEREPRWVRIRKTNDITPVLDAMEVYRQLELKQLDKAVEKMEELIEMRRRHNHYFGELVILDVIGAGCANQQLETFARDALFESPLQDDTRLQRWEMAAGSLVTPRSVPLMERWMRQAEEQNLPLPVDFPLLKALWLSRRGLLAESLIELARSRMPLSRPEACEIVARPIWHELLGLSKDTSTAERARKLVIPELGNSRRHHAYQEFYQVLQSGNLTGIMESVDYIRRGSGNRASWCLLEAWSAAKGDKRAFGRTLATLRCQARFTFSGVWLLEEFTQLEQIGGRPK